MAVVEVACPNCKAMLKAPDNMAGKKARCKKCNASFRIPGGNPADSVGESQMLSAVDVPSPQTPFDFGSLADAPTEPKKPEPKPTPSAKVEPKPAPHKPVQSPSDNPFSFGDEPADSQKAPPPQPKAPPLPPKEKSTPKAKALPPDPKPVTKRATTPSKPSAEAGGFDFGSMMDAEEAEPAASKSKSGHKSQAAVEQQFKMPDDEDVPEAESVMDADAVTDGEVVEDEPSASTDPFGFPSPETEVAPKSSRLKSKPNGKEADTEPERPGRGGYHKATGSSGKTKLILFVVGFLVLGGAIGGVAWYVNKTKKGDQARATDKEKDKKEETPPDPAPPNDPPTKVDPKKEATPKKDNKKDNTSKIDPGTKSTTPGTATTEPPPRSTYVALDASVRMITPQPAGAKPVVFQESLGSPAIMEVEFDKVVRLFPPSKAENDIGVLWEKEKAFSPNTPGNKLVMDVCRPSGTKQYRIEFTGDGKAVPACDLSEDGKFFAHVDNGKLTVWDVINSMKLVDAVDLHKMAPEFSRGPIVAVYFPKSALDAKDAPPKRVVTVSAVGIVHLWDLTTKAPIGAAFIPREGRAGRVSDIKAVTLGPTRNTVMVAVGGAIYHIDIGEDRVQGNEFVDLKGDVPTSLAIAVSGSGPVLYVFETGGDKKEKAIRVINAQGGGKSWRWPESAGKPVGAGWITNDKAVVSTDRGALLMFELRDAGFYPEGLAIAPNDKCRHVTNDVNHWYMIPHPRDPKKSALLQFGPPGPADETNMLVKGLIPTWRIDEKGLSK